MKDYGTNTNMKRNPGTRRGEEVEGVGRLELGNEHSEKLNYETNTNLKPSQTISAAQTFPGLDTRLLEKFKGLADWSWEMSTLRSELRDEQNPQAQPNYKRSPNPKRNPGTR